MVGIYIAYILLQLYLYFNNQKYVIDKEFYYNLYAAKFAAVGVIIGLAFLLKLFGKNRTAGILLAIPAFITLGIFLLAISGWLFFAAAMILFGK